MAATCVPATRYLKNLIVRTGDTEVTDPALLADGKFGDLNKGQRGCWSYLEPIWTTDRNAAVSHIQVYIGGKKSGKGQDYAKGCSSGHGYRYVTVSKEFGTDCKKITDVVLVENKLLGWQHTSNLNEKRGGRNLYIAYRWAPDQKTLERGYPGAGTLKPNGKYHGNPNHGTNDFYVYPRNIKLPYPRWDTHKSVNEFCTNCVYVKSPWGGIQCFICLGHAKPTNVIEFTGVKWHTVRSINANTKVKHKLQFGLKTEEKTENKQETETGREVTWNASAQLGFDFGWFAPSFGGGIKKKDTKKNFDSRLNSFTKELNRSKVEVKTYLPMDMDTVIIQAVIVGWSEAKDRECALTTKFTRRVDAAKDWPAVPELSKLM